MKYLFVNVTAGAGSTGQLVLKAARELQAAGNTCLLAYGREAKGCGDVKALAIGTRLDHNLHALRHRIFGTGGFGSYAATKAFLTKVREYDPDVIWLHNLHGYYIHLGLLFDYLRRCGKPVIWTLHDCWAFTGNCPYFTYAGCEKWRTGCGGCPQRSLYPSCALDATRENYRRKKALFTGIPQLTLQVPSQWLGDLVSQSFLKDYPLRVVPNQADPSVFHPTPSSLRQEYGLEDKFLVLGAANVWEPRKGLADFVALSSLLPESCRIVLIGIPESLKRTLPEHILALPRTHDQQELAQWYTAADVYVSPSVEETFGMTVLEAALCGTTPLVYRGTACQEVAQTQGGILADRGPEHLAKAILQLQKEKTK